MNSHTIQTSILFLLLTIVLTACGSPTVTYEVSGDAERATITWRGPHGKVSRVRTKLPWSGTVKRTNSLDWYVYAETSDSDTELTCTARRSNPSRTAVSQVTSTSGNVTCCGHFEGRSVYIWENWDQEGKCPTIEQIEERVERGNLMPDE